MKTSLINCLTNIQKGVAYCAHYLKIISQQKVEHVEDQLCDIHQLISELPISAGLPSADAGVNTDEFWKKIEIDTALGYLQDLVEESPEEDINTLAQESADAAHALVFALRRIYAQ